MTKNQLFAACGLAMGLVSCAPNVHYDTPLFTQFSYEGNDARYTQSIDPSHQYYNPIISGCNPDPSICRKDSDYYMANSSFVYYPGIPIWHSRDLVNWDFVGYALDRPDQVRFNDGIRISGGIYAPDIKYNAANQTFYLIVTGVDCAGNFIIKTQDPAQGWSDPIPVPEVGGIDPGILFDTDGKAYIVNNDEPAYPAEYSGHRAIWVREFDTATDKCVGQAKVLVDKGIRPQDNPIWIEGPHLYHIGDRYYLMSAEGGTAENHSEVILSSTSPWGPFKPCAINPILTQRGLDPNRQTPITCAGHADLVQTPEGDWWAVFLAVTPYAGSELYNTGRSTFLLPVRWENGQPIILDEGQKIPTVCEKADLQPATGAFLTGNGTYTDTFMGDALDPSWFFLRTPVEQWYALGDSGLTIQPRPVGLEEGKQPSMICRWIKNSTYTASTTLLFTPQDSATTAGLVCFQAEIGFYTLGKALDSKGQPCVVLTRGDKSGVHVIDTATITAAQNLQPMTLMVDAKDTQMTFSFRVDGTTKSFEPQDANILSTNYAGGFTGCVVGMFARN